MVGRMIWETRLRSVLFPAPLWPITPTTSPAHTWRLILDRAQNSPSRRPCLAERPQSSRSVSAVASRRRRSGRRLYLLETPLSSSSSCAMGSNQNSFNDVGTGYPADEPAEQNKQDPKHWSDRCSGDGSRSTIGRRPDTLEQPSQRIDRLDAT